jgi:hypothetical protein
MNNLSFSPSVFRPLPPPLWYVTNGDLTVGPVTTGLLVRGVEHGRVPDECQVTVYDGFWRNVFCVREVAALNSKVGGPQPLSDEQLVEWSRPGSRHRDEEELAHTVTFLSLATTGAESAMFHYCGRRSRSFITRSILGPMSNDRLGRALPEWDPLLEAARLGRPVMGPPYGPLEDALAMRMATSAGGVGAAAMIPIFSGGMLRGVLELSRPGHAFRRADLKRAERIAQSVLAAQSN